jgi:hypothetical protein
LALIAVRNAVWADVIAPAAVVAALSAASNIACACVFCASVSDRYPARNSRRRFAPLAGVGVVGVCAHAAVTSVMAASEEIMSLRIIGCRTTSLLDETHKPDAVSRCGA